VRVPVEGSLVGEEGKGWTIAKFLRGGKGSTAARKGNRRTRAGRRPHPPDRRRSSWSPKSGSKPRSITVQPYNLEVLRFGWNEEPVGAEYFNDLTPNHAFMRAASIYSGLNEIQRNIASKGTLQL